MPKVYWLLLIKLLILITNKDCNLLDRADKKNLLDREK